jgi:hypothetical protein
VTDNIGRSPDGSGLRPVGAEPAARSQAEPLVPNADDWFCDRGNFWGTTNQLLLCARCGQNEFKRHDEPRHYQQVLTPFIHTICDECWDELPEDGLRRYAYASEMETRQGGDSEAAPSRSDDSPVAESDAPKGGQ